jgi:hypothetical protein
MELLLLEPGMTVKSHTGEELFQKLLPLTSELFHIQSPRLTAVMADPLQMPELF